VVGKSTLLVRYLLVAESNEEKDDTLREVLRIGGDCGWSSQNIGIVVLLSRQANVVCGTV